MRIGEKSVTAMPSVCEVPVPPLFRKVEQINLL